MNVILFDSNRSNFYPLSYTRPISEFRIGILTIKEKWTHYYKNISTKTEDYLVSKYPIRKQKENLWIDASVLPSKELKTELDSLRNGEVLESNGKIIAFKNVNYSFKNLNKINTSILVDSIENIWDIFSDNGREIEADFKLLTKARKSQKISNTNTVIGKHIFVEKGAKISCSILNAENGPIYIGKNAEIMEGSMIRGPFALCDHATVKMSAKIYGATTIGPHTKVGGEINNCVIFGYSNKGNLVSRYNLVGNYKSVDNIVENILTNFSSYETKSDQKQATCTVGLFLQRHKMQRTNRLRRRHEIEVLYQTCKITFYKYAGFLKYIYLYGC